MGEASGWPYPFVAAVVEGTGARAPVLAAGTLITPNFVLSAGIESSEVAVAFPRGRPVRAVVQERDGQVVRLQLETQQKRRVAKRRLEFFGPQPCVVAAVAADRSGARLLQGHIARPAPAFVVDLAEAPRPGEVVVGAPVIVDDELVGVVSRPQDAHGRRWQAAAATSLSFSILRHRPPAAKGSPARLSPDTRHLLAYALAIAPEDRPVLVATDLVLGALAYGLNVGGDNSATVLVRALPDAPQARLGAACSAAGMRPVRRVARPRSALPAAVDPIVSAARSLAGEVTGDDEVHVRHVLAVALMDPPMRDAVYDALGVGPDDLRRALREGIRRAFPDESPGEWDAFLAAGEPVLVGNVDSDLVPWRSKERLVDHLDVDTYVKMLCTVVAGAATPLPLSIGLFGPWGSGKSYFMGLMRQTVDEVAGSAAADRAASQATPFCAEVVQIQFNAWHYADANLWASLVVHIFDELARARESDDAARRKERERLVHRLAVYKRLEAELKAGMKEAKQRVEAVEARLRDAEARAGRAERSLARLSFDVAKAVARDPAVVAGRDAAAAALGRAGLKVPLDDLHRAAGEVRRLVVEAGSLAHVVTGGGWRRLALAGAGVLVLAGGVAAVVAGAATLAGTSAAAVLVAAGGVARSVSGRAARLRVALSEVEGTAALANQVHGRLVAQRSGEVARLDAQLAQATRERQDLEARHAEAVAEQQAVQRQLDDLAAGRRLQQFIAERSASNDYRGQLGVVSLVRRDFEQLTRDLQAAVDEYRAGEGPAPTIERIVLYIDDLDRCSPDRVVEVLEAVHLLLAMELFVVVVGVDPRWLLRSLRQHFRGVLGAQPGDERDADYAVSTPQSYLEKIFQIPFVLPSMSAPSYRTLVESLVRVEPPSEPAAGDGQPPPPPLPDEPAHPPAAAAEAIPAEAHSAVEAMAAGRTPPPPALDLTREEVSLLAELAPLVRTPRSAKRMLNVYRMLRATRDLGPASQFLARDHQAVAQLLGLLTGYPELFQAACLRGASGDGALGLLARPPTGSWQAFVEDLVPEPAGNGEWRNGVVGPVPAARVAEWRAAADGLAAIRAAVAVDDLAPYQLWAPRVARFSFEPPVLLGAPVVARG